MPLHKVSKLYVQADALLLTLKDNKCFNLIIPARFQSYLASKIPIFTMANGEIYSLMKKLTPGVFCNAGNYKKLSKLILSFVKLSSNKKKKCDTTWFLILLKKF